MRVLAVAVLSGGLAAGLSAGPPQDSAAVDRAFEAFWTASHPREAASRIEAVVRTGLSFDAVAARVRRGRDYAAGAPRGRQFGYHRTSDGLEHTYTFVVPDTYDHTRPSQVRVHLHGGVGRPRPPAANRIRVDALPGSADEIVVFPAAWAQSAWWFANQIDNLGRILDRVKRTYNVDENRVYLTGSSDGGTGAYFVAFKDTTPWAGFVPLIADMMVLAAPAVRADGDMFPGNAVNKPLFVVNTGRDRLYPAHMAQVSVDHLRRIGATVEFRVYPDADHTTTWWPQAWPAIAEFVHEHPREPLPDKISWQTDRTDRYNRAHWLVIDRLGHIAGESRLPDTNLLDRGRELDFGLRVDPAVDRGRRAADVRPESNAFSLGLRAGDRFTEINGTAVQTGRDIVLELQKWNIGDAIRLVVERDGKRRELQGTFQPAEVTLPPAAMFPRKRPSGRVDLVRRGNLVDVSTEGVRAFTLLLSPSVFDFRKPVRVIANGRVAFDGLVQPSVATLLKWAARDNDRTMVFGAELAIDLEERGQ